MFAADPARDLRPGTRDVEQPLPTEVFAPPLPPPQLDPVRQDRLTVAVAVAVFATLAEEALAGGELAPFDLAFARALHDTRAPEWERAYSVVSWFGARQTLAVATAIVAIPLLLRRQILLALRMGCGTSGRRIAEPSPQRSV